MFQTCYKDPGASTLCLVCAVATKKNEVRSTEAAEGAASTCWVLNEYSDWNHAHASALGVKRRLTASVSVWRQAHASALGVKRRLTASVSVRRQAHASALGVKRRLTASVSVRRQAHASALGVKRRLTASVSVRRQARQSKPPPVII